MEKLVNCGVRDAVSWVLIQMRKRRRSIPLSAINHASPYSCHATLIRLDTKNQQSDRPFMKPTVKHQPTA